MNPLKGLPKKSAPRKKFTAPKLDKTTKAAMVAAHEAAHAVAGHLLGCDVDDAQSWWDDGKVRHAAPRKPDGRLDAFVDAQIAMAGRAFTDAIGSPPLSDNEPDNRNAINAILAGMSADIGVAGVERAYAVVLEATRSLVSTERFRVLALDLSQELARCHFMTGPEIRRFLVEHDPERPTERNSFVGPERHSAGRVAFIRHPIGPHHNRDCVVCKAYPPSAADRTAGENRGP